MTTIEANNGRVKGRSVPAVPLHTFQDSDITVRLHKLSPNLSQDLLQQVRREMEATRPKPPIDEIDYGRGKVEEPNEGHPVYQKRLAEWEALVNQEANKRLFAAAALIAIEPTEEESEWRSAVARHKRLAKLTANLDWSDNPDLDPVENDQIYYVKYICCASHEDLKEFYQAITARSQPTEAAVEAHKASFPGDIQGP